MYEYLKKKIRSTLAKMFLNDSFKWDGKSKEKFLDWVQNKNITWNILDGDRKQNGEIYTENYLLYIDDIGGYIEPGSILYFEPSIKCIKDIQYEK